MKLNLLGTNNNMTSRAGVNLLGQVLIQGIGFFLAPVYARILSPNDYGLASVFVAGVGMLSIFVGVQTQSSINIARVEFPPEQHKPYISSIMSISCLSFLIIGSIFALLCVPIGNLMGLPPWLIVIMPLSAFGAYCISFATSVLIAYKKATAQLIISLSYTILTAAITIFCILSLTEGKYLGKIAGGVATNVMFGICLLVGILLMGRTGYNRKYWSFCLPLVLPLIFHALSSQILSQSDRLMLNYYVGEGETGIYSFCYTMATPLSAIISAFNATWIPQCFEYMKENKTELLSTQIANLRRVVVCLTCGFILVCPELTKLLGTQAYETGILAIPLIALSYFFVFLYMIPANHQFYHKKTKLITIASTLAAVCNIVLNVILIPPYGIMGAAIATLVAYVLFFLFHQFVASRIVGNFPFKLRWYASSICIVTAITCITYATMAWWIARWTMAVVVGIRLLCLLWKNKGIF